MEHPKPDLAQKIKTLQTIHLAICAGMAAAYLFAGNLSIDKLTVPTIDSGSGIYLAIPIAAFFLGNFLFKSQLKQAGVRATLEEKMPVYQTASIIRWAILEGAAFVILLVKPEFVLFGIGIILYLIYLRPTEEKIKRDLQDF